MKKTIALLLAAAGVVTADIVTVNWDENNTANYTGKDSISVVFTLDVLNLPANDDIHALFTWTGNESTHDGNTTTGLTYGVYFDGYFGDAYATAPGKTSGTGLGATPLQGYTMAVIAYTYDKEQLADSYIKLISPDGSISEIINETGGKSRAQIEFNSLYKNQSIKDIYVYNTKLTQDEVANAMDLLLSTPDTPGGDNNQPTPEPTTTTLSLLALAGLAARRRRK